MLSLKDYDNWIIYNLYVILEKYMVYCVYYNVIQYAKKIFILNKQIKTNYELM